MRRRRRTRRRRRRGPLLVSGVTFMPAGTIALNFIVFLLGWMTLSIVPEADEAALRRR
jgi:hypothetical protein